MAAVIAKFFPHAEAESIAELESFISVVIFSGLGLLMGLTVLLLDRYIPGDWF